MDGYNYQERMVRVGIFSTLACIVANFIPAIYMQVFAGIAPSISDIIKIWVVALTAFGMHWVLQPVTFFPTLGISGSYISWVAGSVADIRIPAATMAQKVTNAEAGTPKGDIMATIGIAGSVLVSVFLITVFTFIGSGILAVLPKIVITSFKYILPAVFGAVYAEHSKKNFKLSVQTIISALIMTYFLPKIGIPTWLLSVFIIAGGVLLARVMYLKSNKA